jgi:glycerol dehydrogenase-like iron-containing ADH family enzyme
MIAGLLTLLRAVTPRQWLIVGAGLAIIALWLTILAWGNSRYRAGVADTDAKWTEASDRLAEQARASADVATRREAPRITAHAAQVAAEKEKIDEAIAEGRSPLDALFPAG